MTMPSWMLRRPASARDEGSAARFDALFEEAVRSGSGVPIDYRLAEPKWQFLCRLGDTGRVVLHGSGAGTIREFEARLANDVGDFGAQRGVYAASDAIWAMFFAVIDRDRYDGMLVNSCVRYGRGREHGYFFSLDADQLATHPWREGWVYLLPPDTFVREAVDADGDEPVESTQVFSPDPVVPIARLAVEPQDFPFLDRVHPHHHETLMARAAADPNGFPWVDERPS